MFRAYPLGVMRADFWRYAILFAHGGLYADMDCRCVCVCVCVCVLQSALQSIQTGDSPVSGSQIRTGQSRRT